MRYRLVVLLAVLALAATACGGGSGDSTSGDDGGSDSGASSDDGGSGDTGGSDGDGGTSDGGDSDGGASTDGGSTDGGTDGGSGSTGDGLNDEQFEGGAPQYGGELFFGLEGETTQGWNPATTQCAVSCETVMRAIYDPLFIEDENGQAQPYLLQSAVPNDDFSEWTFTLRPGLLFHDDTAVDSDALVTHFEALDQGQVTAIILRPIVESVEVVDELSVLITLTEPVALFPSLFTFQLGYLAAPSVYLSDDGAVNPVGTGPFVFDSWVPNQELVVTRNPNYWQVDEDDNQLPFLDKITFRPIEDSPARRLALFNGALDITHDNSPLESQNYAENEDLDLLQEQEAFRQVTMVMMNDSYEAFDTVEERRALAQCTDRDLYMQLRAGGNTIVAHGPFSPSTPGYVEDNGFPEFDPDAGRTAWDSFDDPGTIQLGTTTDPVNRVSAELLAEMWSACGLDVEILQVDQGTLVTNAIVGNFEAFIWRQHNSSSLEAERVWWHSDFAQGLATNFGRIVDPAVDAALDAARLTNDPEELRALGEDLDRAFGEGVHNIYLYHSFWQLPHDPKVHNVGGATIPDGEPVLRTIEGRVFLTETWIEQ
jgi:peptide/nickel transport system substrate-binding protein